MFSLKDDWCAVINSDLIIDCLCNSNSSTLGSYHYAHDLKVVSDYNMLEYIPVGEPRWF